MVSCPSCGKDFLNTSNLLRHRRTTCSTTAPLHSCPKCIYSTFRHDALKRHIASQHPVFVPQQTATGELLDVTSAHRRQIEDRVFKTNRHQDRYNFEVHDETTEELVGFVKRVFSDQAHPFKLNISFGFVLENAITNQQVFYYASQNTKLFDHPILIENETDIDQVKDLIDKKDLREYCRQQRPSTKFVVRLVTNAFFYVDKIKKFPIGASQKLPQFIKEKRSIVSFENDDHGRSYADRFCLFRCLAFNRTRCRAGLERLTRDLVDQYLRTRNKNTPFRGITMGQLTQIEKLFGIAINVYALTERGTATRVRVSAKQADEVLNLNLYGDHFSYITDMKAYASKWKCPKCGTLFNRSHDQKRHTQTCNQLTKLIFRGGGYGQRKDVFDQLAQLGIDVPEDLRFFPYRVAFDFEATLEQNETTVSTGKEHVLSTLKPASVSVCSDVPGFEEPKCFVSDGNTQTMIAEMYSYIVQISEKSYDVMKKKFEKILLKLEASAADPTGHPTTISIDDEQLKKIFQDLHKWLKRIPVLGFNSGRFDINLVRSHIFPHILENDLNLETIIKKVNDYLSLTTEHAVFLDIKNYVAAGTSYDKWLKSNDIPLQKGLFPYDWFTGLEKLEETQLPSKEAF